MSVATAIKGMEIKSQKKRKAFARGRGYGLRDSGKAESLGERKARGARLGRAARGAQGLTSAKEGLVWVERGGGRLQFHRRIRQRRVRRPQSQR